MQTPSILNQANATAASSSAPKQSGGADAPFNQMLTQQMSERRNASKTTDANNSARAAQARAAEANKSKEPAKAGNVEGNKEAAATSTTSAPTEATKTNTQNDASATKIDKDQPASDAVAAVPVTAELLAVMANNTSQTASSKVDVSAGDADELTTSIDALGKGKAKLSADVDLKAMADSSAGKGANGKDAALKDGAGFTAAMAAVESGADSKKAPSLINTKLVDTMPGVAAAGMQQVSQTAFEVAQPGATRLTPQVGTPAWDQAVGQKVVWMVTGGQQSAALTLNPPDLGPMQVVLNVHNGQADAAFIASQPEVRQALEAALPKLREMMEEAGIQLGQATISAETSQQQNASGENNQRGRRSLDASGNATDASAALQTPVRISSGQGLVDTFA